MDRGRRSRAFRRSLSAALFGAVAALAPAVAHADDLGSVIGGYEIESRALGVDLPAATASATPTPNRLVDGQVAYTTGDYDAAAAILFDLVNAKGPDADTATYYLAETLYQKHDRGAARTYFQQIVYRGEAGKYYQNAVARLLELAIAQHDSTGVDGWLAAFDRLPAGQRKPVVAYVRGKYAFSQNQFADALNDFRDVPKGSDYELEALYYIGATDVATKELAKATEVFTDLVGRKPRTSNDRRVIELAQLALGRVYYERDEPSKSIDSYLLVDRHSDLFRDALYEVGWVYVKGKQYDKALRALELLSESEPTSTRTPTVRILEGNLRIRKAQAITAADVAGTLPVGGSAGDASTEYLKAANVFTETHDAFFPAYQALANMIDNKADPAQLLAQIAGHSARAFQITVPLPDAAAEWLREEPEVQRVVGLQNDVADITNDINDAELNIARLDGALAAPNHAQLFPALANRRARAEDIEDKIAKIRSALADQQIALLAAPANDVIALTATRQALATRYAQLPDPRHAYSDNLAHDQQLFDAGDAAADEVAAAIGEAGATAVALRMYQGTDKAPIAPEQRASINTELDAIGKDADQIVRELAAVRRESDLGRDLAGGADLTVTSTRAVRRELRAAQDAEHRALASYASQSRDPNRAQALVALDDRSARVADALDQLEDHIDQIVETSLTQVKTEIASDKTEIEALRAELATAETEAAKSGATVLGSSFAGVRDKLYDVVIRTDVGNVDVEWSQKQDDDEELKRLTLQQTRELKQLHDEFKEILDDHVAKPQDKRAMPSMPPPVTSGSTDQGTGTTGRIKPIEDSPSSPATPAVKPDASKTPPKTTTGGSK